MNGQISFKIAFRRHIAYVASGQMRAATFVGPCQRHTEAILYHLVALMKEMSLSSLRSTASARETAVSCIPIFEDNYVWVIHGRASPHQVAVVDPGDAGNVKIFLDSNGLDLRAIFVTHHHSDHTAGIAALTEAYDVGVYGPVRDTHSGELHAVCDEQALEIAELGLHVTVMEVPGHTLDHVAYSTSDAVFCGDTLFGAGCGRLIEGNPPQMWASLSRLARLSPHTRVYCAHEYTLANLQFARAVEPDNFEIVRYAEECVRALQSGGRTLPSTISRELATNPFLRCDQPAVRAAAERVSGQQLAEGAEVFAVLRRWKDDFKPPAAASVRML